MITYKELKIEEIKTRIKISYTEEIFRPPDAVLRYFNQKSSPPTPAAVLMPLLKKADAWELLLTRRTETLLEHSGQVAFPGGRCDPGDKGPEEAALREAREEIGIHPKDVKILGRLSRFLTVTNYLVHPVVGVIPWPYPLVISEVEVSRAFTIPIKWLADPQNHYLRQRSLPGSKAKLTSIYFRTYNGEVLWGASAGFTLRLIDILTAQGEYNGGLPGAIRTSQPNY